MRPLRHRHAARRLRAAHNRANGRAVAFRIAETQTENTERVACATQSSAPPPHGAATYLRLPHHYPRPRLVAPGGGHRRHLGPLLCHRVRISAALPPPRRSPSAPMCVIRAPHTRPRSCKSGLSHHFLPSCSTEPSMPSITPNLIPPRLSHRYSFHLCITPTFAARSFSEYVLISTLCSLHVLCLRWPPIRLSSVPFARHASSPVPPAASAGSACRLHRLLEFSLL